MTGEPLLRTGDRHKGTTQAGMTLLELLTALTISTIVVVLGANLFTSGQRQFLFRMGENELLHSQFLLQETLRAHLEGEILQCGTGTLRVGIKDADRDVVSLLHERFPGLHDMNFKCFELDEAGLLTPWKTAAQPRLIEYEWSLEIRKLKRSHKGSWLR